MIRVYVAVSLTVLLVAGCSKNSSSTVRNSNKVGVTDEWVKTLQVEKIAGAQVSPDEDIRLIADLIQKERGDSFCRRKMFDQPDQDAPNLADPDAPCLQKDTVAADR